MASIPRAGLPAAVRSKLGMGKQDSARGDRKGGKSRASSSSSDLDERRERRSRRSRPWVQNAQASISSHSFAVSNSPASEELCTSGVDNDDTASETSTESSVIELPVSDSRIPVPRRTQAAPRRYVTYAQAAVTSAYHTSVRALTPQPRERERASVPRSRAGSSRSGSCGVGARKPMGKAPIDRLASGLKKVLGIGGNGHTPKPVVRSALKGAKSVYRQGRPKKVEFRCRPKVYVVEGWKEELRRETWRDLNRSRSDCTPYSADEPDYKGIAWLKQPLVAE